MMSEIPNRYSYECHNDYHRTEYVARNGNELDAEEIVEELKELQAENAKLKEMLCDKHVMEKEEKADWYLHKYQEAHTELAELREICVKIYLCYHISEHKTMYKPVQEAWYIGQKIYNERKREGKAL